MNVPKTLRGVASRTSATCSPPDSDATRDNQLGRQALHHLVSLIASQASHHGDPSNWPGSRGPDVQDFTFNLQTVTGPGWIWPFKFTASPDDAAGARSGRQLTKELLPTASKITSKALQAGYEVLAAIINDVAGPARTSSLRTRRLIVIARSITSIHATKPQRPKAEIRRQRRALNIASFLPKHEDRRAAWQQEIATNSILPLG